MKKFFDSFSWAFLTIFSIPTVLIMASWNSLPGDYLYTMKLTLEDTLVLIAPTYAAKGGLQMKYTERRFAEAKKLLDDRQSTEGLPYLNAQVTQTKNTILRAPDAESRRQLAYTYIDTLSQLQAALELQKIALVGARPPAKKTSGTKPHQQAPSPTLTPTRQPAQQTVEPNAPPQNNQPPETAANQISQTQAEMQDTIDELEHAAESPVVPAASMQAEGSTGAEGEKPKKEDGSEEKKDKKNKRGSHRAMQSLEAGNSLMQAAVSPTETSVPSTAFTPTDTPVPTSAPQSPTPTQPVDGTPTP